MQHAEKLDPKETISILELTDSHMWSIAALVEVLERKGLLTKQEVRDVIIELRRRTPKAEQTNPPSGHETLAFHDSRPYCSHVLFIAPSPSLASRPSSLSGASTPERSLSSRLREPTQRCSPRSMRKRPLHV